MWSKLSHQLTEDKLLKLTQGVSQVVILIGYLAHLMFFEFADIGLVVSYIGIATVVSTIATARAELLFARFSEKRFIIKFASIYYLSFYFIFVIYIFGSLLNIIYEYETIIFCISAICQTFNPYFFVAINRSHYYAKLILVRSVLTATLPLIIVLFLNPSSDIYIKSFLWSHLIFIFASLIYLRQCAVPFKVEFYLIKKMMIQNKNIVVFGSLSNFFNTLTLNGLAIFVPLQLGYEFSGKVQACVRLLSIPQAVFTQSTGLLFYRNAYDQTTSLVSLINHTTLSLIKASTPIFLPISALAFMYNILALPHHEFSVIIAVLSPLYLVKTIVGSVSSTFSALNKTHIAIIFSFALAMSHGLLLLSAYYSPITTLLIVTLAQILIYCCMWMICKWMAFASG